MTGERLLAKTGVLPERLLKIANTNAQYRIMTFLLLASSFMTVSDYLDSERGARSPSERQAEAIPLSSLTEVLMNRR